MTYKIQYQCKGDYRRNKNRWCDDNTVSGYTDLNEAQKYIEKDNRTFKGFVYRVIETN